MSDFELGRASNPILAGINFDLARVGELATAEIFMLRNSQRIATHLLRGLLAEIVGDDALADKIVTRAQSLSTDKRTARCAQLSDETARGGATRPRLLGALIATGMAIEAALSCELERRQVSTPLN